MAETFYIKRGDTSPALRFALSPETIDLSGASVSFQMRPRRSAISVDETATIDSALPPIVSYSWSASDTATAGIYEAEFRVTYADGTIETFPNNDFISIVIKEDIR